MNIKTIGVSTSAFSYSMGVIGKATGKRNPNPWTIEKFAAFASSKGLGGVEAPPGRFIPGLDESRLKQLSKFIKDNGMFFIVDAELPLNRGEIEKLMPIAKEFGSSVIRIKTSNILSCERQNLGRPWIEHVEHCISALQALAPKLRENNLHIAIENHQDLDSNDLLEIVEKVGADIVGVNFDIGNAFSVCEDPLLFAEKLGSYVVNIHLKDYKLFKSEEGFRLVRCTLGEGGVDFKTVLPVLAKSSPNAKMVIELGALEARNIAINKPDFWQEIAPRASREQEAFREILEKKIIDTPYESWKTPWEKGATQQEIIAYELEELEASLSYLKTI